MTGDAAAWLEESRVWTERELEAALGALDGAPAPLVEAMRYSLLGGGKRLRPALVRLFAHLHGGGDEVARFPAVAIECIHTYSLVHDDLPCMDDDDLRRGRPTCHKVFGEANAVLAGDALLTFAFEQLAAAPRGAADLVLVLARAAGAAGMVGGQVLDLGAAGGKPTREDVARIHALKTAALLGAACELGAIAAGAGRDARRRAGSYGQALGLCFQAIDDVLDVTASSEALGKTAGKDARQAKPSLVAAVGLAGARAEADRLAAVARGAAGVYAAASPLPLALVDLLLERRA
ncbi:MAG: polyprenyl synthetase family protein [Planctomycetes bacterium]|nr:polyprenyl synthetase family protein [Planctomycetota bacterium]